ncbi:MAG: DUF928 domain-containing protein [Aulosira sp. ZfuVER01]|nr:DUF928 domain-containing protein [Aulosira sp. ZfuVER01]MDZ7996917.1 DUF928 domain-containing protein [Aulosira sp. DedVER01a]MDZ8050537.1 DUF928 domain-containing protein [Aulosira sp. ZfuCHP01]
MKGKLWKSYLFAVLVCLPFSAISTSKLLAADSVYQVAQAKSAYDQYMRSGYTATRQRNYRKALGFFQQAAQLRPGDRYATAAIRNVTGYIQGRRSLIGFVPGKPGRVRSAASRGSCFQNAEIAIPLIPSSKEAQHTTNDHPTFFFYIPKTSETVAGIEFALRDDENTDPLYKESFPAVRQAGIVSVTLPANQPSLKADKEYTWSFSMICDPNSRDRDVYLEGKIELMQDENIAEQIQETPKPLDRAVLYATAGFWENALSILADLRRQNPTNTEVQQYWADLLKSVNLEEVTDKPLLPCCTPQK